MRCIAVVAAIAALPALAASGPAPRTSLAFTNISRTIDSLITILWIVLAGAGGISFILAGFQYLTARGSPEQIGKAHRMILYGLVALVIGLVARGLVFLVDELISSTP